MIFCFEEDANVLQVMLAALDMAGFEAKGFNSANEMFSMLMQRRANLVVVDVTCQREDGASILEELRDRAKHGGYSILLVTTEWMKVNRLCGIEFKDEVCLFKPFNITQFMQAVNKAMSDGCKKEGKVLEFGGIRLETDNLKVTVAGTPIDLTKKEYALLAFLMDNTEQVFTREQLFNCIWESDYLGESRTVDVHIGMLRRKLGGFGKHIKTVSGKGYCMVEIE